MHPEQVLERPKLIKTIKVFGFRAWWNRYFFELWRAEDAVCTDELSGTFEKKIVQINEQINGLHALRTKLTSLIAQPKSGNCEFIGSAPPVYANESLDSPTIHSLPPKSWSLHTLLCLSDEGNITLTSLYQVGVWSKWHVGRTWKRPFISTPH